MTPSFLRLCLQVAFLGLGWFIFPLVSSNISADSVPVSRKHGLLGPEVISCQPGVVNLQQEVGVVDCGHQHLEDGG